MASHYIVDASVVAKWFNKGGTDEREALTLRTAWIEGRIELLAPSLIVYEVCNSIWKNSNGGQDQALTLARLAVRLQPTLVKVGEAQSSDSMALARKRKLTFL